MINSLKDLPYEERLWKLKFPSLVYRRLTGDQHQITSIWRLQSVSRPHKGCPEIPQPEVNNCNWKTRKQNLQANSRSACQFGQKREKEAQRSLAKLHILVHSFYPRGWNWAFFPLRAAIPKYRPIFKWDIWAWNLAIRKSSRSCTCTLSTQGVEFELISLYGQWFQRYWPIIKIALFGHESWPLAKVPEVTHTLSFYPQGSQLSLLSLYGQPFWG